MSNLKDPNKALLVTNSIGDESIEERQHTPKVTANKKNNESKLPSISKDLSPIVQIDDQCFSCSRAIPSVINAFKIACLHYTSSDISMNKKVFKRDDLLTMIHQLLNRNDQR